MGATTALRLACGLAMSAGLAASALAAPSRSARHGDWEVYRDNSEGVCFAVTRPVDSAPQAFGHGDVYFLVSSWRGGRKAQPSFHAGYPLSALRAPVMEVGPDDFRSYADGNDAFLRDEAEPELIDAMRKGADMRVEAQTEDGIRAAYEFSLIGVTAAIRDIEAC